MGKSIFNPRDFKAISDRIKNVGPNSQKKWGKMNVGQMICHLTDQLRMALGEIEFRDKSTFLSRTLIKFLAVHIIQAPPGKVQTLHELNQDKGGTLPLNLEKDKGVLLEKLGNITKLAHNYKYQNHGVFGRLTRNEWGKLIYKHLDHHLRQFSS